MRVVDEEGNMLGVMTIQKAMELAREGGHDLIEISPQAEPPVCKLWDYGKYKFLEQKKQSAARKKQKVVEVKEIKVRPGIEKHDYDVKMRAITSFIEEGNKVKVSMRFKGREIVHQEIGMAVMQKILSELEDKAKAEMGPRMEGRQMLMMLVPVK